MENDKIIAALKERGIRSYGKLIYERGKKAFENVVGMVSDSAFGKSLLIKGEKESIYVPLDRSADASKKSFDIIEMVAGEDASGVTKDGRPWSVKKGQVKFVAA